MKPVLISILILFLFRNATAQISLNYCNDRIQTGAEQTERYLPYLMNKRIAIRE